MSSNVILCSICNRFLCVRILSGLERFLNKERSCNEDADQVDYIDEYGRKQAAKAIFFNMSTGCIYCWQRNNGGNLDTPGGTRTMEDASLAVTLLRECLEEVHLPDQVIHDIQPHALSKLHSATIVVENRGQLYLLRAWFIPTTMANLQNIQQTAEGIREGNGAMTRPSTVFEASSIWAGSINNFLHITRAQDIKKRSEVQFQYNPPANTDYEHLSSPPTSMTGDCSSRRILLSPRNAHLVPTSTATWLSTALADHRRRVVSDQLPLQSSALGPLIEDPIDGALAHMQELDSQSPCMYTSAQVCVANVVCYDCDIAWYLKAYTAGCGRTLTKVERFLNKGRSNNEDADQVDSSNEHGQPPTCGYASKRKYYYETMLENPCDECGIGRRQPIVYRLPLSDSGPDPSNMYTRCNSWCRGWNCELGDNKPPCYGGHCCTCIEDDEVAGRQHNFLQSPFDPREPPFTEDSTPGLYLGVGCAGIEYPLARLPLRVCPHLVTVQKRCAGVDCMGINIHCSVCSNQRVHTACNCGLPQNVRLVFELVSEYIDANEPDQILSRRIRQLRESYIAVIDADSVRDEHGPAYAGFLTGHVDNEWRDFLEEGMRGIPRWCISNIRPIINSRHMHTISSYFGSRWPYRGIGQSASFQRFLRSQRAYNTPLAYTERMNCVYSTFIVATSVFIQQSWHRHCGRLTHVDSFEQSFAVWCSF